MTANQKPEIELEVSCGGSFKIFTDAMACKITVLENALAQSARLAGEAAASSPSAEPEEWEVQGGDPFWQESVGAYCEQMGLILDDMAASVDSPVAGPGSAGAIGARALPDEAETVVRQRLENQAKALAKAQAKIVDQRFTLTYLKNHPIFSRRDPDSEEITVSSADLDKLHGKIKSAMQTAALINDALGEVKEMLAGDAVENEITTSIADMAAMQKRMIEAFCRLMIVQEEKVADPAVSFGAAAAAAADRIASLQEEESVPDQEAEGVLDLSDQAAIDRLLNAEADGEAVEAGEEEMSDEEALKKMQEFGL